ncbi:MAG: DUF1289 domain-containing protein [Rhodobacteraceae bacterium]|nr:DUF1289 domain-containing protein [Paracoccaceae bacterium]
MTKDKVWKRNEPDSPCQQVCLIHPDAKICIGCFRTPEEISNWALFSPAERQSLLNELPQRRGKVKLRRGKRQRNRFKRSPGTSY